MQLASWLKPFGRSRPCVTLRRPVDQYFVMTSTFCRSASVAAGDTSIGDLLCCLSYCRYLVETFALGQPELA